jgi:hypothetical protein
MWQRPTAREWVRVLRLEPQRAPFARKSEWISSALGQREVPRSSAEAYQEGQLSNSVASSRVIHQGVQKRPSEERLPPDQTGRARHLTVYHLPPLVPVT